jgi:hypothetical protein
MHPDDSVQCTHPRLPGEGACREILRTDNSSSPRQRGPKGKRLKCLGSRFRGNDEQRAQRWICGIGLQPRKPGSISAMGTRLRRCDQNFDVSLVPSSRSQPAPRIHGCRRSVTKPVRCSGLDDPKLPRPVPEPHSGTDLPAEPDCAGCFSQGSYNSSDYNAFRSKNGCKGRL